MLAQAIDKDVVKRVADELFKVAGHQRVVGHIFANRLVILMQGRNLAQEHGDAEKLLRKPVV